MMLDVLVKATLVLGVAAAFSVLSRGRAAAATRHAVWVAGLVGAVLVPALSPALPTLRVPLLPAELMAAPPPSASGGAAVPAAWPDTSTAGLLPRPLRPDADVQAAALPDTADPRAVWRDVRDAVAGVPVLAWLWAAGAVLLLARLTAARLSVARLTRARVPGRAPWLALARRLSRRMRVARRLRFLRSDRVAMPMACGVVRPSVVLPAEADAWADDRLQAVLLHELAHVRRHDCLTQLVADAALAVLWFHPLAWVARRAIRRERERACDDLVLTAGTPAAEYASHLLDVARDAQARTSSLMLAGGVAMARPSELEGRLMAILDDARPRRAVTPRRLAAVGAITLLAAVPLSALDLWRAPGTRLEATPASSLDRPSSWSSAPDGDPPVAAVTPADADAQEPMPAPTPSPTPTVAPAPPVVAATPADAPMAAARAAAAAAATVIAPLPPDVWYTPPAAHLAELQAEVAAEVAAAQAALAPAAPAPGQPGAKPGAVAPQAPPARREPVDPKVVAALTGALDDSDPEVRRQALHTLGRFRDPSAIDALVKALAHSDVEMRRHAAVALGQMRDPRASKALQGALKDTDVKVRQHALFALARTRDAAAFDPLVAALKDADPQIRQQAAFGLGQLRDARAVPALASVVGDANRDVRAQVVFALGQTRSGDAVAPLSGALKDSDVEIRRQAAFALGQIRDPRALDALMLAARDQDVAVRKQAFFALGQVGDGRAQDLAIAGLKDADPEVRRMAAFALARLADRHQ